MQGLNWQPLQYPLAAGVNQRSDDRALQPPELAVAKDVQFDEIGGLQTRKPYSALGSTTATGTTISTARRMYEFGRELVMFTKDALYSWNDQLNRWVSRATHLAVSLEEKTVYATPGDQYDCDRAELTGIVFHCWCDTNVVYMAATDKASGAVLLAPTAVTGSTHTRPRLVAGSSRVLLFVHEGTDGSPGNITVRAFDPTSTNPATWSGILGAAGVTVLASANCGSYYDVTWDSVNVAAAFVARRAVTTSYTVAVVTDASTPVVTASTKARTCDGPIAVAVKPGGDGYQVIRANGTNIQGDRLAEDLSDEATGQAIGTVSSGPVDHITAAYRSTQDSGQYRCYAFWTHDQETGAGAWECKSNYVDTGGTIGTEGNFILQLGLGSRAFDHDGRVFVWGVFAGESSFSGAAPSAFRSQLQNTYFLYRDDATLHAKCAFQRGGGLNLSLGRLPGVALTSGTTVYSWCATERREISIGSGGDQKGFDMRAPRDVAFTFDSNDARRCVKLGETLYVSGSEILQYDGVGLYEVGFHVYPWYFAAVEVGTGSLADGTYTYKVTWRWENAKGELDRSTTATHGNVTISGGPNGVNIVSWLPLYITHKTTAKPIAVEVWRTAVNPTDGAPFYLVTSKDPASTSNPQRYIANTTTATVLDQFNDEYADSSATTKETNDENGDVLENLAPPGASIIAATDTRIFLGNVAGDPDRIWYSKLKQPGRVVSFHDALTFDVPKDGGRITGIGIMDGIPVVFRETAAYVCAGDGFDNTGRGVNYSARPIPGGVGCRDVDSIVEVPEGIAFQSSKGKYLLTRGWTMKPIGLQVVDYDTETVLAAHVVSAQHQVRFVTSSRVLVWDYLVDSWAEWSISSAVHAGIWQGTYHTLAASGPSAEVAFGTASYGLDVETAWIKPGDLQGQISVRKLQALAAWMSSCYVRIRVAYDYNPDWIDDSVWTPPSSLSAGDPVTIPFRPSRQKLESVKLRLTVVGTPTQATVNVTADSFPVRHAGVLNDWGAVLTARSNPQTLGTLGNLGTEGNGIAVNWGGVVTAGATTTITVRDHWKFDTATSAWVEARDIIGVKVEMATSTTTCLVSAIEAAITAESQLASVTTAHATAGATFQISDLAGSNVESGILSGGSFANPTGESLKLTGLGLEVGMQPRLYKRYAR